MVKSSGYIDFGRPVVRSTVVDINGHLSTSILALLFLRLKMLTVDSHIIFVCKRSLLYSGPKCIYFGFVLTIISISSI